MLYCTLPSKASEVGELAKCLHRFYSALGRSKGMARRRIFNISDTINCFKPFKCQAALFKFETVSVSTFVVGCLHEFSFSRFLRRFLLFYLCYFFSPSLARSLIHDNTYYSERTLFISILWRAVPFHLTFCKWLFFLSCTLCYWRTLFNGRCATFNFMIVMLLLLLSQLF